MSTPYNPWDGQTLRADATPQEVATYLSQAPEWRFSSDSAAAIGHCSTAAAQALSGWSSGNYASSLHSALFWTEAGLLLCTLAGRLPGAILAGYAEQFGVVEGNDQE